MNVLEIYQDFSVDHATEGYKHCRKGWVNTACPFCTGNTGVHLGWNMHEEYFKCWRCGWHPPILTLSKLLNLTYVETAAIAKQYGAPVKDLPALDKNKQPFSLPSGVRPLQNAERNYLIERNFDPDELINLWKLKATGAISSLADINYRFRIFIPYYWNQRLDTFDTRDITGLHPDKYLGCPIAYERTERKQILYGNQERWKNTTICTEGSTDVWRFGPKTVATSGIEFTPKQVEILSTVFTRVGIAYDSEPQAQVQARKLIKELRFRNVDAFNIKIPTDPADLPQDEADYIVNQIIK